MGGGFEESVGVLGQEGRKRGKDERLNVGVFVINKGVELGGECVELGWNKSV